MSVELEDEHNSVLLLGLESIVHRNHLYRLEFWKADSIMSLYSDLQSKKILISHSRVKLWSPSELRGHTRRPQPLFFEIFLHTFDANDPRPIPRYPTITINYSVLNNDISDCIWPSFWSKIHRWELPFVSVMKKVFQMKRNKVTRRNLAAIVCWKTGKLKVLPMDVFMSILLRCNK